MTLTDEFHRALVTDAKADDVQGFNSVPLLMGPSDMDFDENGLRGRHGRGTSIGIGYHSLLPEIPDYDRRSKSTSTTSQNNCTPKGK